MVAIIRHREPMPGKPRTIRFEGRQAGGPVSLFLVDAAPGQSSSLHLHPYAETWVVKRGEVEFVVGDRAVRASTGDIVVAPAEVPHRWKNIGNTSLELVCVHPADTMIQFSV